jgi:hypothetical protein
MPQQDSNCHFCIFLVKTYRVVQVTFLPAMDDDESTSLAAANRAQADLADRLDNDDDNTAQVSAAAASTHHGGRQEAFPNFERVLLICFISEAGQKKTTAACGCINYHAGGISQNHFVATSICESHINFRYFSSAQLGFPHIPWIYIDLDSLEKYSRRSTSPRVLFGTHSGSLFYILAKIEKRNSIGPCNQELRCWFCPGMLHDGSRPSV